MQCIASSDNAKVNAWQVMQFMSCKAMKAVCLYCLKSMSIYQLNAQCTWQVVGMLHDNSSLSGPCGCVDSGEHHDDDEGEEEDAEHRSEEHREDDADAMQQDRRASHAKASTRNSDEQMPDAAHDAGVFAWSACCNMLHVLGLSEHALTLVP